MNETLEGMAQALFKSWFVDFDPVIDNALAAGNPIPEPLAQRAETRRQAIANGTANREAAQAFPDSFRFTEELGWIPEGWEAGMIGKLASVKGGYAFKSKDFKEEGFPVLKIKNIVGDGTISITDCDFISPSLAEKNTSFELQDGNLLMAMTGATVGKIGLLLNNKKRAYLNQRVAKISGKAIANLESYLFCFFKLKKNFDTVVSTAEGSAQPNISSKQIENIPCPISNSEIIEDFLKFSQPVFRNWIENLRKSQTLAKLRNVLLPKLISGELRIPQAEKMVEKAVA
jgi:type I restriction enzyme S subunit